MTKVTVEYYDMIKIREEFLKYAPCYAQREAEEALDKVIELQQQGILRDGVYYILLSDLVGSTGYGVRKGYEALQKRIQRFVTSSFRARNEYKLTNLGLFVKEIGDAVLYVFQHFPDILKFLNAFKGWLSTYSEDDEPYNIRTCVHIGEVALQGVNPLSLAVSQVFKMEKSVPSNEIFLTKSAYEVAWPSIARAYHGFEKKEAIQLPGIEEPQHLYRLMIHDTEDIQRIAEEDHDY